MAGLAWAFVDQTLEAVAAADAPELVAVVEQEHEKALQALSSLQDPENERAMVREAWAEVVLAFVDGVNSREGDEAWTALRDSLQGDSADGGDSGAGIVSGAGSGGAGLLSGPVGRYWVGHLSWQAGRMKEVFASLVVLSALPWAARFGEAEAERVAVTRERLGRVVVGELWHSVSSASAEAVEWAQSCGAGGRVGRTGWGVLREMARRVAGVAGPSKRGDRRDLDEGDVPLTAGLALAFVDQTLAAVRNARVPELVAVVEQERRKALRDLSSLRNTRTRRGGCVRRGRR